MICVVCGGTGTVEEWKFGEFAHIDCSADIEYEAYEAELSLYAEDVIGGLEV